LNPACTNNFGSSEFTLGHDLIRASKLLALPLGRYARQPLRGAPLLLRPLTNEKSR